MPGISAVKTTIPFSRKGFSASAYWATRNPSNLVLTAISESRIDAAWDDAAEAADGLKVYWSLDNVTWTLHGTALFGAEAYSLTSLPEARRIYVKVVAYKDANESDGATDDDYTAMKLVLTATGSGAGVANLLFNFATANVVATLDGNGRFYSNNLGTLGESTTYTYPFGSLQGRYIKVTSGVSNLLVFVKGNLMEWGNITSNGWVSSTNAPTLFIALANCPRTITTIYVDGNNTISGAVDDLPPNNVFFINLGSNVMSGDFAHIPATVTYFLNIGTSTINEYTAGRVWATGMNRIYLQQAAGNGLSATEVDNLLIDLAAATWGGASRRINLPAPNAARTAASNAAVATLNGQSVTVVTA